MALTRSVNDLVDDMRKRTDNEGTSALDRFPTPECVTYLNRAVWSFWRIMTETSAGNWKVSSTTLTTTAGTSIYSLDASFYRLLNVNATINSRKQWLVPMDRNERAALSDTNVGWSGQPFRYELVGSNIEFLPVPSAAYTIEVRFVPDPPTLSSGQSIDCVNGDGVNFLIDSACIFMAEKDENMELAASLRNSVNNLQQSLAASFQSRDQAYPSRIQDVRGLARGGNLRNVRWGRW